jgi:hypothetical protein
MLNKLSGDPMIKTTSAYLFALLNVLLFTSYAIEIAAITPEAAALEGMTRRVYASIAYVDGLMVLCSLGLMFAIFRKSSQIAIISGSIFWGLYICDTIMSTAMSIEANTPESIYGAWTYAVILSAFFIWLPKFISKQQA